MLSIAASQIIFFDVKGIKFEMVKRKNVIASE